MSFFETASLVLISDFAAASASAVSGSGTNTGKAYSIKPTDGSGDFDFERGSDIIATRVNSSGLIEKGRGNFLLQSNNFDTTWSKNNVNLTGSQSGYDGSNDAWILRKTGTTGAINQTVSSLTNLQTFSIYAKPGDLNWIRIIRAGKSIYVDLENQVTGSTISGGIIDIKITPINEWSRISLTINQTSTNTVIYPADGDNDINGTSGFIYIQDAQLEQGLVATDFIETTTAPLRAGLLEDEPRFDYHNSASATPNTCPSLLLEPSRANLLDQSEYFEGYLSFGVTLTTNYGTSPEGLQNSTRVVFDDGGDALYKSLSVGSGDETTSIYVKGTSGETIMFGKGASVASGDLYTLNGNWQRLTYSGTNLGAIFHITTYGGATARDIEIYGAQLEEGSYPTSYIPTYGTAATRGADDAEVVDNLTIGNGSEFGVYYEIDVERITRQSSNPFIQIQFATANGSVGIKGASDASANYIDLYGTTDFSESFSPLDMGAGIIKFFINYSSGTGDFYLNGTKYTGVISGPTSGCEIDSVYLVGAAYKLKAKQFLIFPEALSDTDCEILTGATTYSSFAAMASALNYTVYE